MKKKHQELIWIILNIFSIVIMGAITITSLFWLRAFIAGEQSCAGDIKLKQINMTDITMTCAETMNCQYDEPYKIKLELHGFRWLTAP